ncbi:hypothetical protein P170DRAFT_408360 [Aspergillus steynii IBT 23096]|uniref:Serine hydrolase domain-containing protein n=1 Tax=Aspergillus steynii IBT 23096 TaxID=1392250 RepID=A0A2I2G8Q6_9EURO|nr:uncharacterized protein P170DRAFT_408360 [Aspergillus steynii IBT 23096]PLB49259.1 hypothetical protein P170DRAFT_408360 [Aspergillus steynii IBT 23096]
MRFLCLHGAGTSGEIFEIQSGGLSHTLSDKGHHFEYIDGRVPAPVEPELAGICEGPFYNHYSRDGPPGPGLSQAIAHVMQIIEKKGPFDAVMGFSQGAALAFSLLVEHAKTHSTPLFKAAVFICGAPPFESSGQEAIKLQPGEKYPLSIPTTSIVGKQDYLYESSMLLYSLCDPAKAEFYDHGSRHLIPFDMKNTNAMLAAIERTIERAERGE